MAVNAYNLSETPIVDQLGIQMRPLEGLEGVGALGELPPYKEGYDPNIQLDIEQMPSYNPVARQQETIPIYQIESQTPDPYINLQDVYGTSYMPMFEWVKKIQVGEKLYDPFSPEDSYLVEQYKEFVDEYGVPEGLPDPYDWKAIGKEVGKATLVAAAPSIAGNILGAALFGPVGGWIASTVLAKPIQKAGSKLVKETKGALDSVGDFLGDIGGGITSGFEKAGSALSSGAEKVADTVGDLGSAAKKILTGGRVICNELRRQGLLETKDVLLDYKFTKEHLTPQHVAGYHFWAVNVVKRLRKGKGVKFWKHIAGHRANEIAYIYGERDKPDYLGKLYRKIFEPVCWGIGLFCKETDWSVLYEDKEIC